MHALSAPSVPAPAADIALLLAGAQAPAPPTGVRALFETGGWVMYPLLALSLVALALIIERALFWTSTSNRGRLRRLGDAADALRRGETEAAARFSVDDHSVYGRCVGRLVGALREGPIGEGAAFDAIERVRPPIERFATTLSTIITAAPILGILGTVLGIIDSFSVLGGGGGAGGDAGTVELVDVASGIAKALYTTAFGLIIAIGALLPYAIIRAKADRCLSSLEAIAGAAIEGSRRNGRKRASEDA